MEFIVALALIFIVIGFVFRGLIAFLLGSIAMFISGPVLGLGIGIVTYIFMRVCFPKRQHEEEPNEENSDTGR